MEALRATIAVQAALIRILLSLLPDALRHLTDADRRQLAELAKPLGWKAAAEALGCIAAANTIRGWYRQLVTRSPSRKTTATAKRRGGRKPIPALVRNLIVRLARQNMWGHRRLVGALAGLGYPVSRSTIRRVLRAHGIKPAPERKKDRIHWRGFLAAHWQTLASIDFTTIPVFTLAGWKPTMIGVVMHVASRRVHCCVVTQHPDSVVMRQVARNLTMADTGFFTQHGITHLIHDGGGEFCKTGFDDVLRSTGIEIIRTPPRSPNCNPHIERFFRSLKGECLHHFWFVGDRGLRHAVHIYCDFHNHRRPHQGIGNRFVDPDPRLVNTGDRVERHRQLGGLLNFYCRSAA
jgi:transposase InsO family protein